MGDNDCFYSEGEAMTKPKKRDPLSEAIKNAELIETAPHLHPAYVVELAYAIRTLRGALTLAKMATK